MTGQQHKQERQKPGQRFLKVVKWLEELHLAADLKEVVLHVISHGLATRLFGCLPLSLPPLPLPCQLRLLLCIDCRALAHVTQCLHQFASQTL